MDRELSYRHTQVGWVVLVSLLLALAVMRPLLQSQDMAWVVALVAGLLALVGAVFGALTVTIDAERIVASFGIGLVRRRIPLADIRTFRRVRNRWYHGWGVRLVPGGWMYNVSGLDAVELVLRDGRRFRIGTNEPERLFEALQRKLGDPAELGEHEPAPPPRKLAIVLSIVLGVAVLVGVGVMLAVESRPPRITNGPTSLRVDSAMYDDEIADAEIEQVTLLDTLPPIRSRTNGFALGSLLRGSFELADGRKARIYVDADAPPFVEVRHSDGLLIFNAERADDTRSICAALRERLAQR